MHSVSRPATEYGGACSSCEDLSTGLFYTSAYYEEKQMYCNADHSFHAGKQQTKPSCGNHPVEINENCTTNIDLPPLIWRGYNTVPKILSLTNTGRTILISGQWIKGRPYIEGGPLNGTYIFSQIHFHSPSEHEIDGKRYPLEMHVVHYKTSYLTQERAMLEKDGTVVLVYLFQVLDTTETNLSSFIKLTPQIEKVNSRTETTDICLEEIVKPFSSNYYVYWGSVRTGKNSYLLQWIVNGCILYVTSQEAAELLSILKFDDVDDKSPPRMKPENNIIYHVEEIEHEKDSEDEKDTELEKEIEHEKIPEETPVRETCRSCQEWLLSHHIHNCANRENSHVHDDYPSNNHTCVCKLEENHYHHHQSSDAEEDLSDSNIFSEILKYCSKKKACKKKRCKPTTCSSKADCDAMDVEESESNKVMGTTSCPSVDIEVPKGEYENNKGFVRVKIASSTPSMKNESTSNEYENDVKVKMRRKRANIFEVVYKASSGSQKSKKNKKEKPKKKKKEECPPSKPTKPAKKTKKKCKYVDPDSDSEVKKSKSSKTSQNKNSGCDVSIECELPVECEVPGACEVPVECIIATVPEKSFDEILREHDTTWLEDGKFKVSKTDTKLSEEFCESSKSTDITSEKSSTHRGDYSITTLFKKMRISKAPEPPVEDATVNFLLKPNSRKSYPSSSYTSPKSVSEELKCVDNKVSRGVNVPDITVNTVTLSGVRIPKENSNESGKEFCVQVELLFHSNNKDFSECVTQEYNLALMYNQNILQEYKGVLSPNNLQIGNYEKLELVPQYPELDNISIRLQDCIVKMETADQLCMRAKFLMKELDLKNIDAVGEQECEENTNKKITVLSDVATQCSIKENDIPKKLSSDILRKIRLQAKVSEFSKNVSSPHEEISKRTCSPVYFGLRSGEVSRESLRQKNVKDEQMLKDQKCNVKLKQWKKSEENQKNHEDKERGSQISNSSEEVTGSKKETMSKKDVKDLKNLFPNRKKTVYFMYDKIEKDQSSGKKIFVGTFRSKAGVSDVSNEMTSFQSIDCNEINEDDKILMMSAKGSILGDIATPENFNEQELKIHSPTESKHLLNDKKDIVTLHKFKPKHLKVNNSKKERLSLVVGKALNKLQKDSKNFKRLADIVGLDKKENSKICVYELHASSENYLFGASATDYQDSKQESNVPFSDVLSDKSSRGETSAQESYDVENHKPVTKKGSQSAVLIIPVEVESLSKVEVILVEHSENPKKTVVRRGRDIIPCLDC